MAAVRSTEKTSFAFSRSVWSVAGRLCRSAPDVCRVRRARERAAGGRQRTTRFSFLTQFPRPLSGIDVMTADGLQPIALSSESDSSPAWSPDGKRIAFVSKRDGYEAIYVMGADGGGAVRITKDFRN